MLRLLALVLALTAPAQADEITDFPTRISESCRFGRAQLYDECGSQTEILARAAAAAKAEDKTVLVVYGAEWCIWCHVLSAHFDGQTGAFRYRFGEETATLFEGIADREGAEALNAYVAQTFVVAHIEDRYSPDGPDLINRLGAPSPNVTDLPLIFTVRDGQMAAWLDSDSHMGLYKRREGLLWYRGYHRGVLMDALKHLEEATK